MRPRSSRSLAGSPLLIGAVTTLVVIVAVFLSYNANSGLPFVPTYDIKVQVPDASSLGVGNDVRFGGTRVGTVSAESVYQNPRTGAVNAVITLKLEKREQPLPADTTVVVRDRSALGEKYLELTPGHSRRTLPPGSTLPLSAATPQPVEIDQIFNMFNAPTRAAQQTNLAAYGDAFAGRGGDLNDTISDLAPALANLEPLARTLSAPGTQLAGLFKALEQASAQVAPVAPENAQVFVDLDTTFKALAGVAPSIGAATDGGPPSLTQATYSLAFERPFIRQLTRFFSLLAPGAVALREAAPSFGRALAAGAQNLPAAAATNRALSTTLADLAAFAQEPGVIQGLNDLTQTAIVGGPTFADLAGMQAVCNYPALLVRNFASIVSEGTSVGTWMRALPVFPNTQFDPAPPQGTVGDPANTVSAPNNEGAPASAPANGGASPSISVAATLNEYNHLHSNPYPYVGAPGPGAGVCEAGYEVYAPGQTVIGHAASHSNGRDFSTAGG